MPSDPSDRLAAFLQKSFPYVFCYPCLSISLSRPEKDVREAAQIVALQPGFKVMLRSCYRCERTGQWLVSLKGDSAS